MSAIDHDTTIPTIPAPPSSQVSVASVIRALEAERESLIANIGKVSEMVLQAAQLKVVGEDAEALAVLNSAADLEFEIFGDCSCTSPLLECWDPAPPLHLEASITIDGVEWRATLGGEAIEIFRVRRGIAEFAGKGRWDGGIVDCDAAIGEAVYSALESGILEALEAQREDTEGAA